MGGYGFYVLDTVWICLPHDCVEGLSPSWWHCFGKWWKLWEVGPCWRKWVTEGVPLKIIPSPWSSCLLPVHLTVNMLPLLWGTALLQPSDHDWIPSNLPILSCLCQGFCHNDAKGTNTQTKYVSLFPLKVTCVFQSLWNEPSLLSSASRPFRFFTFSLLLLLFHHLTDTCVMVLSWYFLTHLAFLPLEPFPYLLIRMNSCHICNFWLFI
jgi:hypothetical protein